jgi:hypothetical protein
MRILMLVMFVVISFASCRRFWWEIQLPLQRRNALCFDSPSGWMTDCSKHEEAFVGYVFGRPETLHRVPTDCLVRLLR